MPTLKDLLKKENAILVSVEREGKYLTHMKGNSINSDVEVKKGEKYLARIGKEVKEKTV